MYAMNCFFFKKFGFYIFYVLTCLQKYFIGQIKFFFSIVFPYFTGSSCVELKTSLASDSDRYFYIVEPVFQLS